MMGGGGGGSNTTVQKADPWSGVQPYLKSAYAQAANVFGQNPNNAIAPLNQLQMDALANIHNGAAQATGLNNTGYLSAASLLGANNNYQNLLGNATNAFNLAQGNIGQLSNNAAQAGQGLIGQGNNIISGASQGLANYANPQNNPYLAASINSAIRPLTQNFQESVLPSITSGAIDAGQLGGSRQGIAQGIASRGYLDSVGDITTNMSNNAYNQGLTALQSLGSLGTSQAGLGSNLFAQGLGGYNSLGDLGSTQQGLVQRGQSLGLSAIPGLAQGSLLQGNTDLNAGNILQNQAQQYASAPYNNIAQYLGLLTNGASLGGTSSSTQGGGSSPLVSALGGGLAGYGIGGPWGALAGGLFGLFS